MSDSMYYNQEITIDDINGIAHDIGHTTFNAVSTDKFGVDELNRITADLVTKGVLHTDGECKPMKSNNNVIVSTGVVVFADGAKMRLDTPQTIATEPNSYIYAYEDKAQGRAYLCVSEALPVNDDAYVRLARVDSYGNLADERAFCQSKGNWNCTSSETVSAVLTGITPSVIQPAFADWELLKVTRKTATGNEVAGIYDRKENIGYGRRGYNSEGKLDYAQYKFIAITVDSDGTISIHQSGSSDTPPMPVILTICGGSIDETNTPTEPNPPQDIEEVEID